MTEDEKFEKLVNWIIEQKKLGKMTKEEGREIIADYTDRHLSDWLVRK